MFKFLATLGPIGYLPAPGTCGTLATILLLYYSNYFKLSCNLQLQVIGVFTVCFFIIVHCALENIKRSKDPSEIVLDEVLGTIITFFSIPCSIINLILGFVLFRFFDITKPFGIKKAEKLSGVWGVMLDDIIAGIFSCALLLVIHFIVA